MIRLEKNNGIFNAKAVLLALSLLPNGIYTIAINLTLPDNYKGGPIELIFREGAAARQLEPKEPQIILITGTIDSPFQWLEQRLSLIDQKNAHILVSRDNISICLITEEKDHYKTTITGKLEEAKKYLEFGINNEHKTWEPIKLSKFFKMNRAFFPDKSKHMEMVALLKNFKAKINQDVENSRQDNGSKTDNFSQVVDSNLPESFKVQLPLFKGFAPEDIEIEIYADVDGRDISLTLGSAGAEELREEYRNRVIDEQLDKIRTLAPGIVIIEQ